MVLIFPHIFKANAAVKGERMKEREKERKRQILIEAR